MTSLGNIFYILLLIFYLLVIAVFGYTFALADVDSSGLNGKISRFLYVYTPEQLYKVLSACLGPTLFKECAKNYDYCINERNPIMQIVYLVVLNSSFICWLIFGAPMLPNSMVGYHHKFIAYAGLIACHYSFYIACKKNPGVIVKDNIRCFSHHPYDGALYVEGYGCRTCEIKKVRPWTLI